MMFMINCSGSRWEAEEGKPEFPADSHPVVFTVSANKTKGNTHMEPIEKNGAVFVLVPPRRLEPARPW